MYMTRYLSSIFLLLLLMSQQASAESHKRFFSKTVKPSETTFDITSHPIKNFEGSILKIIMRERNRKIAEVKADVDYLPKTARAIDLTGDGIYELAIVSPTTGKTATEMLDVYWLEGKTLHRSTLPKLDEKNGYKGGDRFYLDKQTIVRNVPVYLEGDITGHPTGEPRSFKYKFNGGKFSLTSEENLLPNPSIESIPADNGLVAVKTAPVKLKEMVRAIPDLTITEISAIRSGIEIIANGEVQNYKTFLMNNPERIVVDIFYAVSPLTGKKVPIKRFGIDNLHVTKSKGALRIIMDTTERTFDSYKLKSYGDSLFIYFYE